VLVELGDQVVVELEQVRDRDKMQDLLVELTSVVEVVVLVSVIPLVVKQVDQVS
jgi:hypothetical protein